jgi:hypothetical protein
MDTLSNLTNKSSHKFECSSFQIENIELMEQTKISNTSLEKEIQNLNICGTEFSNILDEIKRQRFLQKVIDKYFSLYHALITLKKEFIEGKIRLVIGPAAFVLSKIINIDFEKNKYDLVALLRFLHISSNSTILYHKEINNQFHEDFNFPHEVCGIVGYCDKDIILSFETQKDYYRKYQKLLSEIRSYSYF